MEVMRAKCIQSLRNEFFLCFLFLLVKFPGRAEEDEKVFRLQRLMKLSFICMPKILLLLAQRHHWRNFSQFPFFASLLSIEKSRSIIHVQHGLKAQSTLHSAQSDNFLGYSFEKHILVHVEGDAMDHHRVSSFVHFSFHLFFS